MKLLKYLTECDISVLKYLKRNNNVSFVNFYFDTHYYMSTGIIIHPSGKHELSIKCDSNVFNIMGKLFGNDTSDDFLFQLEIINPDIVQYYKLVQKINSRGIDFRIEYNPYHNDKIITELEKIYETSRIP